MRLFFIAIIVLSVSCGKNPNQNALSASNDLKIFESKSFASISHESESSVLRRKLLNQILEQKLAKKENYQFTSNEINEELNFIDTKVLNNGLDHEDYNHRLNFQEKVVVLNDSLTEVFFLPKGIPFKEAISHLKLSQLLTKELIIFNESELTQKNHVTYIVHFSMDELIENDKFFNKTIQQFNIQQEKITFKVDPRQKIEIHSKSQFFIQDYQVARVGGNSRKCDRGTIEAGMCNQCTYEREVLTNAFSPYIQLSLSHLDLLHSGAVVKKNQKETSDKSLYNELEFEGQSEIEMTLKNKSIDPVGFESRPRNYDGLCQSLGQEEYLSRQIGVLTEVTVIIWGRGNLLKSLL